MLRIGAAAIVTVGHLTQPYFSTGWPNLTFLGRIAVAVFFVLSGFVIRYVTVQRRGTLGHYAWDRASRIYSVAVPALVVTLVADTISRHVNPAFYATWIHDYSHPTGRILENLFFTANFWTRTTNPLSNSPFWSLNYEVSYYLLYGLAFYLTGWKRWIWLVISMLAMGPTVLVLAPLWFAGCVAHDLYQRLNASGKTARYLDWIIGGCALALAGLYAARHPLRDAVKAVRRLPIPHIHLNARMGPEDCVFGLFAMLLFFRVLAILRGVKVGPDGGGVKTIRFISEGTFTLYLLHFPLLVLIGACVPYDHGSAFQKALIFLAIFILGVLTGHPCNILKMKLRSFAFNKVALKT
jgi:peptidoglycan/LPS O-acetylase OafA/YrhL